jgi:hypothetical protein
MAKYLLTNGKVFINGKDLSDHAFSIDTPDEREEVDVSGFSPTGTREFLPGVRDQSITIGFLQDFGTASVHQTLEPLYRGGSTFTMYVMPNATLGTSATNPLYGGTASMFGYNGLAGELNARGELEVTFRPASGSGFAWGTVAP